MPASPRDDEFTRLDKSLASSTGSVRKGGARRLVQGGIGFALVLAVVLWLLPLAKVQMQPMEMAVAAIPGAYALVGLLELLTGISYREWAGRWDSLKGWQRGVLGTMIVAVAMVVIITVFAFFASMTGQR